MEQALKSAQQAIADGQALVEQGVTALKEAMERLLGEAQARLARTHQYLDDLRDEQETAVDKALSDLEEQRERSRPGSRSSAPYRRAGGPGERAGHAREHAGRGGPAGGGSSKQRRSRGARRLARQLDEVEERIGPLQQGTQQVRGAADRLGIDWP